MSSVVLRLVIIQQTINNKHTEYGHFGSLEVGFPHQMVRSVPTAIPVAYTSRCNRFTMILVMSNNKTLTSLGHSSDIHTNRKCGDI